MLSLEPLLQPKSIAVIGASNNPEKVGFQILKNLKDAGYKGAIFPVNLKKEVILDLQSVGSVLEIETPPDLAVVAIPKVGVKDAVNECINKGIKSIVVITAGFAEIGEEGKVLQDEIKNLCEQNGVVLLGPNCFGAINTHAEMNTTFAKAYPASGPVSFFSQSGAIIASIIDWAKIADVGFSKIISLGNKASIKESQILEYLYKDPDTKVILAYLESLGVDPDLNDVLVKYAKTKPTIVIFGGKSDFGVKAAKSHTGSIVSSYVSVKTYLHQAGAMPVDTLSEFLGLARVFAKYHTIAGKRIAIITNAGGPGILASDAAHYHDLKLAELTDETRAKLQSSFRPEANLSNPIDVLGDASDADYQNAINIVSEDPNVDGIVVLLTPQTSTKINETADIIINYSEGLTPGVKEASKPQGLKPLVTSFIGGESLLPARKKIREKGLPCYDFPENAIQAMAALIKFASDEPELVLGDKTNTWPFDPEKKIETLKNWSFPVLEYQLVESDDAARAAAATLGYPVVLKTADPAILHKSDSGGVKLNLKDETELICALNDLGGKAFIGKMIKSKLEIFLGAKRDPKVGEVIAFGTGGIYAELYGDFSYRIAPVTHEIALNMIAETKIGKILAGARGQKSFDLDLLAEIIVKASWLMKDFKNISEVDFNPILADENNYYIVDTRIICE